MDIPRLEPLVALGSNVVRVIATTVADNTPPQTALLGASARRMLAADLKVTSAATWASTSTPSCTGAGEVALEKHYLARRA